MTSAASRAGFVYQRLGQRALVATVAVALVFASLTAIAWALTPAFVQSNNPFGLPIQEARPAGGALGATLIFAQSYFYRALTEAAASFRTSVEASAAMAGIGFVYGVFHAAGPGHGKSVIAAYTLTRGGSLRLGLLLSLTAALLQACMAVGLVGLLAIVLGASSATISVAAHRIEIISFSAIASLGALLTWRKSGEVLLLLSGAPDGGESAPILPCKRTRSAEFREFALLALAAGIRPCSGAILLLVFCLGQGIFGAGIVGSFAMAAGTAVTTGTLALLTILSRRAAERSARSNVRTVALAFGGVELLAAAFVAAFGLALLLAQSAALPPPILD